MIFDPILPAWRGRKHRAEGHWRDRTLLDYFDEAVARKPDAVALVARRMENGGETVLSWRQLKRLSDRIALGLHAHGLGRGDVLAFQLPNWWQFYCLHIACLRLGVCSNPLMPIFRERELSFMVDFAEAKALVVPKVFRGHDHATMARKLRPSLTKLEHLFVVGENFEAALLDPALEREADTEAVFAAGRPDPDDVVQLLYTSGTTGEPKGVMHSSNTLIAVVMSYVERIGLGEDTAILMGSPLAHQTGFMYGLMLSSVLGAKTCYLDIWDPEAALQLIQDEAVTFTMGATPFLSDLANSPALDSYDISSLVTFVSAGAPLPRVLVERASARLGCFVHSGWGMTENGLASGTRKSDPPERVFGTDGSAVSCLELRVIDEEGTPLPDDEEGRLQVRGAGQFVGYLKRPERYDTSRDGWFETGDNARMDADGYIRISGRSKDIIIRGGENIPVAEVEDLLYRHPSVADCAIVAMPDERLGERCCAFVTLRPGAAMLTFDAMCGFLLECRLAKPYLPERLELLDAMPRTASGKIQKYRLRERASGLRPMRE